MAIPKIQNQNIIDALKYIDENGVPSQNQSTKYELVSDDGKRYPPKYVIAVANHIANGGDVSTDGFNAVEAKSFLETRGFTIEEKQQEKFELCITADNVESTDERFTMDDLGLGDNYEPLDTYFKKADGTVIRRVPGKNEKKKISNRTMSRIACQVFEKQLAALSVEDKENFPICRYKPNSNMICGIYASEDELKKHCGDDKQKNIYDCDDGKRFVFYCWNIFTTIYFVQECLKRFGNSGDQFILVYREKKEDKKVDYIEMLENSKNIILHGAPGTGKTYLAKQIATEIVSEGNTQDYDQLSEDQKKQIEFVQFHPSYDYTDFVEGLRPRSDDAGNDGTIGFELRDGIFKSFADRARKNYEDSKKSKDIIKKELTVKESIEKFFSEIEFDKDTFETKKGTKFTVTGVDDKHIYLFIPGNLQVNKLTLKIDEIRRMLESDKKFEMVKDLTEFFGKIYATQEFSYDLALYKEIKKHTTKAGAPSIQPEKLKNYVFIIDEINRGEISKIFGELFFSIDPGYRGESGAVSTQYSSLHDDPDKKFYIPENVYIIGTMNDIDRSVDTFDFAMRRRFRFVEISAKDSQAMLNGLDEDIMSEAIKRMDSLNDVIAKTEDLNENYQIGAAYFLKLKDLNNDFDALWKDYLKPLLREYVRGMRGEDEKMNEFEKAYKHVEDNSDGNDEEISEDQG